MLLVLNFVSYLFSTLGVVSVVLYYRMTVIVLTPFLASSLIECVQVNYFTWYEKFRIFFSCVSLI